MKITFSIYAFFACIYVYSQGAKLNVIYQKTAEITHAIPDSINSPKYVQMYYNLNLTKEASEYFIPSKTAQGKPDEYNYDNYIYKNLEKNLIIFDFINHKKSSLPQLNWTLEPSNPKKILGYNVKKATLELDANTSIIAWYTPNLPYKNGPDIFHGLPGLILEIEQFNNTENGKNYHTSIKVVSIDMSKNNNKIVRPDQY